MKNLILILLLVVSVSVSAQMKHRIVGNQIVQSEGIQQDTSSFTYAAGWRGESIPTFDNDIYMLGSRYYDPVIDSVTWTIIQKQLPTLDEARASKILEFDNAVNGLYMAITWYVVKKWASGESTPQKVKDKIIEIDTDRTQIEVNINALTDVIEVIKYELPYSQIKVRKDQIKAIR